MRISCMQDQYLKARTKHFYSGLKGRKNICLVLCDCTCLSVKKAQHLAWIKSLRKSPKSCIFLLQFVCLFFKSHQQNADYCCKWWKLNLKEAPLTYSLQNSSLLPLYSEFSIEVPVWLAKNVKQLNNVIYRNTELLKVTVGHIFHQHTMSNSHFWF